MNKIKMRNLYESWRSVSHQRFLAGLESQKNKFKEDLQHEVLDNYD